jgi:hypothetical protein
VVDLSEERLLGFPTERLYNFSAKSSSVVVTSLCMPGIMAFCFFMSCWICVTSVHIEEIAEVKSEQMVSISD